MGWPKIPADKQREEALKALVALKDSPPVKAADAFFARLAPSSGHYAVTRSEITRLLRDVYEQGWRDALGMDE